MRLQLVRTPDALHRTQRDTDGFGHRPAGPVGCLVPRLSAGQGHHLRGDFGREPLVPAYISHTLHGHRAAHGLCRHLILKLTCLNEGRGWDPKGPVSIHRARAALDTSESRPVQ